MGIRRRLVSLLSYSKGRPKVVQSELSTPTYLNRHCGEPFLVLGNGPSLNKYGNQIYRLIEKQQPVVLEETISPNLFIRLTMRLRIENVL